MLACMAYMACCMCFLYTCTAAQHEYSHMTMMLSHTACCSLITIRFCNMTAFQFRHIIIIACEHAIVFTYINMHMYILYNFIIIIYNYI